jgi:uncharacterized protein YndB with AHSA1/START domain
VSGRSVQHDTIVIERTFEASPARVFAAWADPSARARWDVPGDGWRIAEHESDFRVGGRERSRFGPPGGPLYTSDGRDEDIVTNSRIIMAGTMARGETRISTSVLTVELLPVRTRTRLILTEQAAFLDGEDSPASRRQGWGGILIKLDEELPRDTASPPH